MRGGAFCPQTGREQGSTSRPEGWVGACHYLQTQGSCLSHLLPPYPPPHHDSSLPVSSLPWVSDTLELCAQQTLPGAEDALLLPLHASCIASHATSGLWGLFTLSKGHWNFFSSRRTSLYTVMVTFNTSPWLGHSAQIYGQTFWMFL